MSYRVPFVEGLGTNRRQIWVENDQRKSGSSPQPEMARNSRYIGSFHRPMWLLSPYGPVLHPDHGTPTTTKDQIVEGRATQGNGKETFLRKDKNTRTHIGSETSLRPHQAKHCIGPSN